MIFIQIADEISLPLEEELIKQAVTDTLQSVAASQEVDLAIVFTDDQQLHQLNMQFLGIDAPTDVLSFPADFSDPDTSHPYLGDVLISIPRAQVQAQEHGHGTRDEVLLLIVHGVLHLLGYDHADSKEQERMWSAQSSILSRFKP